MKTITQKITIKLLGPVFWLSLFAQAAFSAPVLINFSGTIFPYQGPSDPIDFNATLSFDSELAFRPYTDSGHADSWIADNESGSVASLTIYDDQGNPYLSPIRSIVAYRNIQTGENYHAAINFYGDSTLLIGLGGTSLTPFTWGTELLPSPSNPIPFFSPGAEIEFGMMAGPDTFLITSYSVTSAVPLPASALLLGAGLIVLGGLTRQRRHIL